MATLPMPHSCNPMARTPQFEAATYVIAVLCAVLLALGAMMMMMLTHPKKLQIHPNSTLFRHPPQWVVFHEVIRTAQDYMREVIAIEPQWLSEIAPHYYQLRQSSSSSSSAASTATTSTAAAAAATSASTFGSSSSLRR